MKIQFATSLLVAVCVHAKKVVVDDPGTGNKVHFMGKVPKILGYPDIGDPPLTIDSPVPVSILRYNDNVYLEGGQPVQKDEIYVIVKSNCTFRKSVYVKMKYTEYNRSSISEWDTANYTDSISISIIAAKNVTLVESDKFLKPSSFIAYWNYTTHWCLKGGAADATAATNAPSSVALLESEENLLPAGDSASASNKSGMFVTLLLAVLASATMFLCDGVGLGRQGVGLRVLAGLAVVGVLVVSLQAHNPPTNEEGSTQVSRDSIEARPQGRRLTEVEGEICSASVEVIVDGCRREWVTDKVDVEVTAPRVRVIDVELTELSSKPNPNNTCTTDYVGLMEFNATNAIFPTAYQNDTYMIPSLGSGSWGMNGCSRAIEGRPFVDADGNQLQADACMDPTTPAAWSVGQDAKITTTLTLDEDLGQEWADRALGEHASVPAFAAFTIALMSNNAPPALVQDALRAAMDEVRHAKTSFEVAALLLGTTVEPGPIPPSVHSFGQDLSALAVAAAQEGCIDETLSALVAAYEVDTRLDQNTRIDETTKSELKTKMRTIALEETTHSALAWRTVRWTCQMDPDACSIVKNSIFDPQNLSHSFNKRFGRYELDGDGNSNALSAWERVKSVLIPFVLLESNGALVGEAVDCSEAMLAARELAAGVQTSLLEEMAMHIIHNTVCATVTP